MEFNSTQYCREKRTYKTKLTKEVISMIEDYANFYGVPSEQVVQDALMKVFANDETFFDYHRMVLSGELPRSPPIRVYPPRNEK